MAGFIHLIDASAIRYITIKMFNLYGVRVTSTHDSFQVSPAHVGNLKACIKTFYLETDWHNVVRTSLLGANVGSLDDDTALRFTELIESFYKSYNTCDLMFFDTSRMYTFEDV